MPKRAHAIIIGAGYGGLALANLLARRGYAVSVYEKNATPGGRIAVTTRQGFTFDLGPSWYLMPEVFEQYYHLFGQSATERLALKRLTPAYKVFFEQQPPLTIAGDLASDSATFEEIEPGAANNLRRYVQKSSHIYSVATGSFLYSNFERPLRLILRHAWLLASTTLISLDRLVSRYFRDTRLKQILEYQAVFLGNSPYQLPGIYSLMSKLDFETGVFYPTKGMPSLAADLLTLTPEATITYHYDSPVKRILHAKKKATGIELESGEKIAADIVISNADLHHTETKLLDRSVQTYPESYWKNRQPSPGGLVISLGIKGALPELSHHSLLFVDAWKENFDAIYTKKQLPETASLYICNPSKSDPSLAPDGHETLFILAPIPAGVSLTQEELEQAAERYIAQCARMLAVPDLAERIVVRHLFTPSDFSQQYNAWLSNAFGGESHLLRQSALLRTRNTSKKLHNLYYVGAGTLPGVGLPMCLISAQQTFKKIEGIKKDGPLDPQDIMPADDVAQ